MPTGLPLAAALAVSFVTAFLVCAALRPKGVASSFLVLWLAWYAQVVLISELLSEARLLGGLGFLVGHVVLGSLALLAWVRAGRPALNPVPGWNLANLFRALARHPVLAAFGLVVAILSISNLVAAFFYPPVNGDANAYHLPRAYYWTTLQTARPFPAVDFRMTEFPPNPSFVYAWILALGGGVRGLHVPQWCAGLAVAAGVMALARDAGASRPAAFFAGLSILLFPLAILEMASSQTDLFAAATSLAAVHFGLRGVRGSLVDRIWFGAAVGLALGTKITFVFLLPGLAAVLLLLAFAEHGLREGFAFVTRLAAFAVLGFAAFGAYVYFWNTARFGDPIASPMARRIVLGSASPAAADRVANAWRYAYQVLDFPGLASDPAGPVPKLVLRGFQGAARLFGSDLDAGVSLDAVRSSRVTPDENRSGFGVLGFLVFFASPILLLWNWARGPRDPAGRRAATLAFLGLSWFAAFVLYNQDYTPQKVRYFLVFMPLLSAAVLPRLFAGGRLFRTVLVICAVLALVSGLYVVRRGPDGIRLRLADSTFFPEREGVESAVANRLEMLPGLYPNGARIGVVSEFNDLLFPLFRSLPRFAFVPVSREEVPQRIRESRIDAALVGQFRNAETQGVTWAALFLPRNILHTGRDGPFVASSADRLGMSFSADGDRRAVVFERQPNRQEEDDPAEICLATEVHKALSAKERDVLLVLPMKRLTRQGERLRVVCRGRDLVTHRFEAALAIELPKSLSDPGEVYLQMAVFKENDAPFPGFRGDAWAIGYFARELPQSGLEAWARDRAGSLLGASAPTP